MTKYYAVAGKGGSGKTTFTAHMLKWFALQDKVKPSVLAIDSDSNANLNEVLGLHIDQTISGIGEDLKNPAATPPGMPKDLYLDLKLQQIIKHSPDFDLLVMGNPSAPGCYCYPNDLLRKYLNTMSHDYDVVIIDCDDGLEEISRRTISHLDILFIISDSSTRGIHAAARISQLVRSLNVSVKEIFLVVNKTQPESLALLAEEIHVSNLSLIGEIPMDPLIAEYDAQGKPLYYLSSDTLSVVSIHRILQKVIF